MQHSRHLKPKYRDNQAPFIVAAKTVNTIKIRLTVQPYYAAELFVLVVSLSASSRLVLANFAFAEVSFSGVVSQFQLWINRFAGSE